MPFKKSAKKNDWAMNHGKEVLDSANDDQGQCWQFRVAIRPDKDNLQKALDALNQLDFFRNGEHPTAKLMQLDGVDLSTWDGTLADASDRDQRGKELCVYIPYDSKSKQFLLNKKELKNLMLDIWKVLQDAGVDISYTTPNHDEKEVSADKGIITPFSYSAFKPYTGKEGILRAEQFNPMGHPDPIKGIRFSISDLTEKNITSYDVLTVGNARIAYMQKHHKAAEERIIGNITKMANTKQPSDYLLMRQILANALDLGDEEGINEELQRYNNDFDRFYKTFPTKFHNGGRIPILDKGYISHLLQKANLEEKKKVLGALLSEADGIVAELQATLIKDWPYEHPEQDVLKKLIADHPYEFQSIQRQLVHLKNEALAIEREQARQATSPVRSALITGSIAGTVGLAVGAGIGVALVMTGVFAPFGVGILGIVALAALIGAGSALVIGGLSGGIAYSRNSIELNEVPTSSPKSSDLTIQDSYHTAITTLSSSASGVSSTSEAPTVTTENDSTLSSDSEQPQAEQPTPSDEEDGYRVSP